MSDLRAQRQEPPTDPLVFGGRLLRIGDRIGPYVFEREIGSGGMARVLLSRDPNGMPVALKVLRANRMDTGLQRFRREFHALSRLSHPNIIRVDAYGDLHGHPYIAMEYVDGPDLHTVIRSLRHADDATRYRRVEDILIQLCRALAAIHRRGLVHRDLKPSNVLLTKDGVCKLTDFGIVKDVDPKNNPHLSTTLVGTWAYTSPEHIMGQPVDHRSDLYGLGVILFALLTGKRPFVAENMAGYLEQHRDRQPPRASSVRPGVPAHLDDVCSRLLQKAPRDRFQSAQEILHRLEADDASPDIESSRAWEPPLVGQARAIEAVEEAVYALTGGRGGTLRVLGDDGLGRTRMLEHAIDRARMLGLPYHRHAFRSDLPLFSVAIRLARDLLRERPEAESSDLARLVQAWSEGSSLRGDNRYALYDAMKDMLARTLQERPRLLVLDDIHDAAPQELDLFRFLVRSLVHTDGLPLLVVKSARRGFDGALPAVEVTLEPLRREDMRTLVGSLVGAGRAADLLAERLHRETEGNPYFATEFLRSLITRHIIVRTASGWQLSIDPAEIAKGHLEIPPSIVQILRKRLDGLPERDQQVLQALSVAGHETPFEVLHDVLGTPDDEELLQGIDRLIDAGLLHEHRRGDELSYSVVHRTLAELVCRELPDVDRRRLHREVARASERPGVVDPENLDVIGEHYLQAGEAGLAYQHLVVAAGRLVERSMPEAAWALSEKAATAEAGAQADLAPAVWGELRMAQLQVRVTAWQNRAAWDDAVHGCHELLQLAEEAGDERTACKARLELSRVHRQRGDAAAARADAEAALKLARRLHYRLGVAAALHSLAAIAWFEGEIDRCEQLTNEGLLIAQGPQLAAERARLLLTYALSMAVRGQLSSAVRHLDEAEGLFRELRMQTQRALALANAAEVLVWAGDLDDAWRKADEAASLSKDLSYRLGLVVSLRARGIAALELGRRADAHDDLLQALRIATDIGLHEEVVTVSTALARLTASQRDLGSVMRHAAAGIDAAVQRDPECYLPVLHAVLARALARERPRAAWTLLSSAQDALNHPPRNLFAPRRCQLRLALAWAWLALGDKAQAIEVAEALIRDKDARAFRLLLVEARQVLAATTTGQTARRHQAIGAEMVRDDSETVPFRVRAPSSREPRPRPP